MISESMDWSRREDLNPPSAVYDSAALALSYTGSCLKVYSLERAFTKKVITLVGQESEKTAMQLQPHTDRSFHGQRHVIARRQYLLEPVSNLEFP